MLSSFNILKKTPFGDIFIHDNKEIMSLSYKESTFIDLQLAQQIVKCITPLLIENKVSLFISDNTADYINSTPEARVFLSDNEALRQMKAHAIILNSLPSRLIINSFIRFNKPIIPIKEFSSYQEAIKWLKSYS